MRVLFPEGKNACFSGAVEAIDYLHSFNTKTILIEPEKIFVRNEDKALYLVIFDGSTYEYLIRRSFLEKLFKWYSFPIRQLEYFDIDTITAMCNDYIINIKAKYVNIKIEDGDALTITSEKFSDVNDIELIQNLDTQGIERIFIDDYTTSIRIEEKFRMKPFRGDEFGMGMLISNSETGFSAVKIKDYLLRYVCSNGAYIHETNSTAKFYHYNLFVQSVFDKVNAMLEDIEVRGGKIEARIRKMEEPISSESILQINKNITRATAIKLLNDVIDTDRTLSRYELFNLITERAKAFDQTRRMIIEGIAGNLVETVN
ncbi:MAG: hypothetical protein FD143_3022 [Ignavibacteria bacterium]|nr:MAG: hypothetical protein FD143_3022 [Ignavibacteria bacterium]KAF0154933.1 MAG: hypothetical protein FD188_3212 [Ignavibacteria bacterium]